MMRILAFIFGGIGLVVLAFILVSFVEATRMQSWDTVPAQIISGGYEATQSSEGGATYKAYGKYTYVYQGRNYTSDRVAINDSSSDNIGDFQKNLGAAIERARKDGTSMVAYVNPSAPEEATLNRDIRWPLVGLKMIFVVAFGGFGGGIWYAYRANIRDQMPLPPEYVDRPWLANPAWRDNNILSGAKTAMYFMWGFAVLWCLISAPLPFVLYEEVMEKKNYPALLGILFPLVGIGLLIWAIKGTLQWKKFGTLPLRLDPFPGNSGGHVGGVIETQYPYQTDNHFMVTLSSIYSFESGSGKNRRRSERVNWHDSIAAHTEMGLYGTRIVFRFDVPPDLPASDALQRGDDYQLWRLNVSAALEGIDLNRDYEIPVYPGTAQSSLRGREVDNALRLTEDIAQKGALSRMQISAGDTGVDMFYPVGRHALTALTLFIVGIVFSGAGYFMIWKESMYFMGGIFALVGVPVFFSAVYTLANSLQVRKTSDGGVESIRRVFGLTVRRRYAYIDDIGALQTSSNLSTQQGSRYVKYFSVFTRLPDGKKMTVGEGFQGTREAEAAIKIIRDQLGLRSAP